MKIANCNIVSVSWGDHLVFGEGDGRLGSLPVVRRRMQSWKAELGAGIIHWRGTRDKIAGIVFSSFRHDNPGPVRRNDWRA